MNKPKSRFSAKEINELATAMGDRSQQSCEENGGYPEDYEAVRGEFLVGARIGPDGEPDLFLMPLGRAMQKFKKAKKDLGAGRFEDLAEAMYENGL